MHMSRASRFVSVLGPAEGCEAVVCTVSFFAHVRFLPTSPLQARLFFFGGPISASCSGSEEGPPSGFEDEGDAAMVSSGDDVEVDAAGADSVSIRAYDINNRCRAQRESMKHTCDYVL